MFDENQFFVADGTHHYANPFFFDLVELSEPCILGVKNVLASLDGMQCCNVSDIVFNFSVLQTIVLISNVLPCALAVSQREWYNHDSLCSVPPSSVSD